MALDRRDDCRNFSKAMDQSTNSAAWVMVSGLDLVEEQEPASAS
jgi:hypothetical protein